MKHKLVLSRSSYLTSIPVILGCLILGVLAAVLGWTELAGLLIFLFLLSLLARLWAEYAAARLEICSSLSANGIFPGETLRQRLTIYNGKFLPVLWLELFFPLNEEIVLTPEQCREPEEWEKPALKEQGYSACLAGYQRLPGLMWYEKRECEILWTGKRRGIYSSRHWTLRAGDGFGLSQVEVPLMKETRIAVYPKLVDVNIAMFLRNHWNSESGAKGVMEDITVIRSTRNYMLTDPVKRINWRLAARGMPLTVNIYEDTLPRSVHFLFDGESFQGPEPDVSAMEEALSILASVAVSLEEQQIPCGVSLPVGAVGHAVNVFPEQGTEAILWALAEYSPKAQRKNESGEVLLQNANFQLKDVMLTQRQPGRYYYIARNLDAVKGSGILESLEPSTLTLLLWDCDESIDACEKADIRTLREGVKHGA